jgi:rare lipoprotein A
MNIGNKAWRAAAFVALALALAPAGGAAAKARRPPHSPAVTASHVQVGMASYYGRQFINKKTASGERLDPAKMTAASKTLPLGARVKVTNLENGKSAEVKVTDRGPVVKGRIIDVTPKVADTLGFKDKGVSLVAVEPIDLPHPPTAREPG